MTGLFVINPVKGNTMKRKTHKRRRMTAKQLKYFGKRRGHRKVRRNPVAAAAAPRKHRRRTTYRRRVGVYRARARSYAGKAGNFMTKYGLDTVLPASVGALGALGVDMLWSQLPIPVTLQTGPAAPVVRLAGAVGVGMAVGALLGKKWGRDAMTGATVVTMYDLLKGYLKANFPSLPGMNGMSMYVGHGHHHHRGRRRDMGMYVGRYNAAVNIGRAGMGEFTPDYVHEYTTDSEGIAYGSEPEPQY